MSYAEFSYFYDEFNGAANYNRLFKFVRKKLLKYIPKKSIVADLGCGTGELTLMLAQAGFDMIAIDVSEQMLSVLTDKMAYLPKLPPVLVLNQDITSLDLYGTIAGAVSTFDTFNHLDKNQFEKAIQSASFFMEKGAAFIFDMNTPYKHTDILADNTYNLETEDAVCLWKNTLDIQNQRTHIQIDIDYHDVQQGGDTHFSESFYEYYYTQQEICDICEKNGLEIKEICDGERFGKLKETSQRMMFITIKKYTQEKGE